MQRQKIALSKQCILIHPAIFRPAAASSDRTADHFASECLRNLRHSSADVSHPHYAPGLPFQLIKRQIKIGKARLSTVRAWFHILIIIKQLLTQRKRHSKSMLCHHAGAIIPHIGDLNASGTAVFQITVVITGGKFADQFYLLRPAESLLTQRWLIGNHNIRIPDSLPHFLFRHCIFVNYNFSKRTYLFHWHIRAHTVSLQNNDFHVYSLVPFTDVPPGYTAKSLRTFLRRLPYWHVKSNMLTLQSVMHLTGHSLHSGLSAIQLFLSVAKLYDKFKYFM